MLGIRHSALSTQHSVLLCEVIMKPGWKTTEFWLTLLTALPGVAVTAGFVPSADKTMLDSAASKIAAGLLAAVAVAKYIHGRALVKSATPLVLLAALFLSQGSALAQSAYQPNYLLPWRGQMERRLQQLEQQRQPVAPPSDQALRDLVQQLLAQNQQLQNLLQQRQPQAAPLQQIPLGGPPRQEIPLGGAPKQDLPLGSSPRQDIPFGPAPRQ